MTCRDAKLRFYPGGQPRRWFDALLSPMSPVGPGWRKWAVTRFPGLFRRLPEPIRREIVDKTLGPAPAWYVRSEIEGKVDVLAGREIVAARETAAGVEVVMLGGGVETSATFDHVLVGSGYRVDARKWSCLDADIIDALDLVAGAPRLSPHFETSVPGLFVVGVSAAYAFGPAQRFVCGAEYAARRVCAAIAKRSRAKPLVMAAASIPKPRPVLERPARNRARGAVR